MSLKELRRRAKEGEAIDFLFFYGPTPRAPGAIDESCLSQWYPAPFVLEGKRYATAEHYMMAGKARLFGDLEMEARILESDDPSVARKLGRRVRGFDETRWRERRVVEGNLGKFGQDEDLRAFLLGTGERVLVEASPVDRIWGIGLAKGDEGATDPRRWRGENLLGFALMRVRAALRR